MLYIHWSVTDTATLFVVLLPQNILYGNKIQNLVYKVKVSKLMVLAFLLMWNTFLQRRTYITYIRFFDFFDDCPKPVSAIHHTKYLI